MDVGDDRFSRFRLLTWWDQERIRRANVLVIGAGALGNEILKNLALIGFERVAVADCDRIELSNLSRSVLYRAADVGRGKAEAAAAAYREIYPAATVTALPINVLFQAGAGLFGWADMIIAGLDNRETRLFINRWAWRMNRPWVDGAIEGLRGVARVFLPGRAPCYECTLGETDWRILERRMSCNLLTRSEMEAGKVPTTPTTSAVIAGIEVQEALKLLHGLPVLASEAFVFDGIEHSSYKVAYTENPDCMAHETYAEPIRLPQRSCELTLDDVLAAGRRHLAAQAVTIEFSREIIERLVCPACGAEQALFAPVGTVAVGDAHCPHDGAVCAVKAIHSYTGSEPYGARKLSELGLPAWDVFVARARGREVALLIDGDRSEVMGELA